MVSESLVSTVTASARSASERSSALLPPRVLFNSAATMSPMEPSICDCAKW